MPGGCGSMTMTWRPWRANCKAQATPMMPAPTTAMSALGVSSAILLRRPVGVPLAEQRVLAFGITTLGLAEAIGFVEVQGVAALTVEHHQVLVIQHQIVAFVEGREHRQRGFQLQCLATRLGIALGGLLA